MSQSERESSRFYKILPFLPRRIADADPAVGQISSHTGALLFADISGFTSLTEKMGQAGREGAEELTVRLNHFFEGLLGVIGRYGGDVLKFGGDALLVGFGDSAPPEAAVACAGDLLQTADRAGQLQTQAGRFRLRLHVGLSFAPHYEIACGAHDKRREQFLFGTSIHRCQKAADLARPGEIVAAIPSSLTGSFDYCKPQPRSRGFYLLIPSKSSARSRGRCRDTKKTPKKWWPCFLDPQIRSLVANKKAGWIGEHRAVSVVFVFFKGSDRWPVQTADTIFPRIFDAVEGSLKLWGGVWSRSDPGSAYQKLLFFFGAPATGENDPQRSVGFALELRGRLNRIRHSGVQLDFGIGVATGRLFCGFAGGVARREYTVMGNAINLAARLAARSFGGRVTADQATARESSGRYVFRSLRPAKLKGKAAPVQLFRPVSALAVGIASADRHDVEYYPQIREDITHFVARQRAGRGYMITIVGEAGCGKSTLARRILERITPSADRSVTITVWPEEKSIAFSGLSRILAEVFKAAGDGGEDIRRTFRTLWPQSVDPRWQPLFADLLGIPHRPSALVRGLDQQARLDRLTELFPEVVAAVAGRVGGLLLIDNYQWLDFSSRAVLSQWWSNISRHPTSVVATSRDDGEIEEVWKKSSDICHCYLGQVGTSDIVRLVQGRFPGADPPSRLIAELEKRSRAVPAVAEAYLSHWAEQGLIYIDPRNPRRLHIENLAADDLPDALMAAYVRRLDRLDTTQSEIVRAIAIRGGAATLPQLKRLVSSDFSRKELISAVNNLEQTGILSRTGSNQQPAFSIAHPLLAQAAYQTMSFTERRLGHTQAAKLFEKRRGWGNAAMLARHYLAAGEEHSALPVLQTAALEASRVGAYPEARHFLHEAGRLKTGPPETRLDIYSELAGIEQKLGNYDAARRLFSQAERVSQRLGRVEKSLLLKLSLGHLYWIAGKYDRCKKTVESILRSTSAQCNRRVMGRARHLAGELQRRRGQFEKAESILKTALVDFRQVKDKRGLLDVLNTLGIVCWSRGKLTEAAQHFRAALGLGSGVVDLSSRARLYNNLGILSEEQARLKRARQYYHRAFEIFSTIEHRRNRAYCLGNLANIDRLSGCFDPAHEAYEEVLRETEAIGEAHAFAYTLGNLGDLYADFGDFDRAAPYYRRTLGFANRVDDDELKAETKIRMATVALARGKTKRFDGHITSAAEFARKAGSVEFQIKAELLAASHLRSFTDHSATIDKMLSLLERARQARLILYQVLCHQELSRINLVVGDHRKARRWAAAGLKLARKAGFGLLEIRLHILSASAGLTRLPADGQPCRIDDPTRRHITAANEKIEVVLSNMTDESLKETFFRQEYLQQFRSLIEIRVSRVQVD